MTTLEHLSIPSVFSLPLELVEEVIKLLPLPDQQSFSLTCHLGRKLTLQFIFGHLQLRRYDRICNFHLARHDIKAVVKKLDLWAHNAAREGENINIIFQLLETLPNLQSFKLDQFFHLIEPTNISKLIASLRHAPLLEFVLNTGGLTILNCSPTIGLSSLEKLSITWNLMDTANQPGGADIHLYELIRPSLLTLVDLRIAYRFNNGTPFDLQLLKPAGNTLRSFEYFLRRNDDGILDTISIIFPHLTKLILHWKITGGDMRWHSVLWKNAHIKCLARIQDLVDLTLSSDFEVDANDTMSGRTRNNYSWYVRSYKRRFEKTLEVASACKKLQRCTWIQVPHARSPPLVHPFVIEGRRSDGKNNLKPWVVRGLKQDWMGRDYLQDGSIVKCKLEDLPGNIIGENNSDNDSPP